MGRRGALGHPPLPGKRGGGKWSRDARYTTLLLLRPRDWGNCSFIEVLGTAGCCPGGGSHHLPTSSSLHLWVARLRASCTCACRRVWRGPGRAGRPACDRLHDAAWWKAAAAAWEWGRPQGGAHPRAGLSVLWPDGPAVTPWCVGQKPPPHRLYKHCQWGLTNTYRPVRGDTVHPAEWKWLLDTVAWPQTAPQRGCPCTPKRLHHRGWWGGRSHKIYFGQ